jgi:hypothetical protein
MTIRSLTAGLAVAAVAAGVGASSASANTITFDVPITGTVTSCTGELVTITGTQHVKQTDNSSLSGIKSQIEMNLTGVTGVTPTGVRYVMNDQTSDIQHADFDPFGNAEMTMEESTLLNRQGETDVLPLGVTGDDLLLHVLTHLTVSNGVARADKQDLRAECR